MRKAGSRPVLLFEADEENASTVCT